MPTIRAFAATAAKGELKPFEYDPCPLGSDQVEVAVTHCGVCHSDLSMLNNDWAITAYPFVPGHEAVGTVAEVGPQVKALKVGDRVGLGWNAGSCLHCRQCLGGDHNLCAKVEATIVGRHGGFANRVRCQDVWAIRIPDGVESGKAGPLFCGGITVFNPIVQFGVQPTHRVGVVGIGGLGHMALQFLNKWGCEVVAFSSSAGKTEEAKQLGAHSVVNSRDDAAMKKLAGSFDFILNTVNVTLNWQTYIDALAPKGQLHFVGAVPEPISTPVMPLIMGQKSISGSPTGGPGVVQDMLAFCARHGIAPVTEAFPLSEVNDAMAHLKAGKARYRIVLENDLKA